MVQPFSAPALPGVYIMRNAAGDAIYVGKAKSLKKRMPYYFSGKEDLPDKTRRQVAETEKVEFIVTDNEVEALVLENTLIKKNRPKYNISLKESFRYMYVQVTDEEFPRILSLRKLLGKEKGKIFGPFVSGEPRAIAVRALRKMFQIRTCERLPKRECLLYHIGQCGAPCIGKIPKAEYLESVKSATKILEGDMDSAIKGMEKKMSEASKGEKFEEAKKIRDDIGALRWISGQRQKMDNVRNYDSDFIGIACDRETCCGQVFNVVRGAIRQRKSFNFPVAPDFISAFLKEYYSYATVPDEIVLRKPPEDSASLEEFFQKQTGKKPKITVPKKGAKEDLLALVEKNAALGLNAAVPESLVELKAALRLPLLPKTIECFDISNLGGENAVASMVRFAEGKPDKGNYRHFKIRGVSGQNDFASMKEVVYRRYFRLKMENGEFPDLVVVDGGKPQLSAALEALLELGENDLPVIGLAKKHDEIYLPTRSAPVVLERKSAALKLLQAARDEAHRFANRLRKIQKNADLFVGGTTAANINEVDCAGINSDGKMKGKKN